MRRWLMCVGMAAVVVIGGVSAGAVAGTLAANRRLAHRDARGLLGRLRLPGGAQRVAREPSGDGAWLRAMPGLVASSAQATAHEWWIVPGSPTGVLAYIEAHPPRGASVDSTGSGGNFFTGQTFETLTYAWAPVGGVIDLRELEVIVTAVPGHRTGVLAESDSVWLVPRPRAEKAPDSTREIDITVSGSHGTVAGAYRVSGGRVSEVDRRFDALEVVQPYVTSCPSESPQGARVVTLEFRAGPAAPVLAQATFTAFAGWGTTGSQCDPINFSIAGRRQTPLLGGDFFGWLGRLLHTSFAAPADPRATPYGAAQRSVSRGWIRGGECHRCPSVRIAALAAGIRTT